MHAEKVLVNIGVGQVVTRDVAQGAETLEDVVGVRVFDDVISRSLLITKESLLVEEGSQVAVHHLGVVPHTDLLNDSFNY